MNKKFFDNTSLQSDIKWGNIQLPGMTDEELHSKQWHKQSFFGKTHKQESKAKIQKANIGKIRKNEDWVPKMANTKKGKPLIAKRKPIRTPSGYFDGIESAAIWAESNGLRGARDKISKKIHSNPEEFYFISKEEFCNIGEQKYITGLDWLKNTNNRNGGIPVKVSTPNGIFPNRTAAAKNYGVDPNTIANWILKNKPGFSYID